MANPTNLENLFLNLVNEARAEAGVQALSADGELVDSARSHDAWMDSTDTFSHTGEGGSNAGGRMADAGYGWQGWGENIAWVTGSLNEATVQQLHTNLMNSPGHYANIVKGSFDEIGIGLKEGTMNGRDVVFVTQNFGTPNSQERAEADGVGGSAPAPQETPVSQATPETQEIPAVVADAPEATSVIDAEAADVTPVVDTDTTTVTETAPDTEVTPVVETTPVADDTTVVDDATVVEATPDTGETTVDETTVVEATPDTGETPATDEPAVEPTTPAVEPADGRDGRGHQGGDFAFHFDGKGVDGFDFLDKWVGKGHSTDAQAVFDRIDLSGLRDDVQAKISDILADHGINVTVKDVAALPHADDFLL